MNLRIKTKVNNNYKNVFENFNQKLFLDLAPPILKVNLIRFDGCKENDQVHLEIDNIIFKQKWISLITEFDEDLEEIYFIDKGATLPFPLKSWKHEHRIQNNKSGALIVDNINYKTYFKILDIFIYPVFWFLFSYRKKVYQQYFN